VGPTCQAYQSSSSFLIASLIREGTDSSPPPAKTPHGLCPFCRKPQSSRTTPSLPLSPAFTSPTGRQGCSSSEPGQWWIGARARVLGGGGCGEVTLLALVATRGAPTPCRVARGPVPAGLMLDHTTWRPRPCRSC
jgi:hypothetical protein